MFTAVTNISTSQYTVEGRKETYSILCFLKVQLLGKYNRHHLKVSLFSTGQDTCETASLGGLQKLVPPPLTFSLEILSHPK